VHNLEGTVLSVFSVPTVLSPTSPGNINPVRKEQTNTKEMREGENLK
jgi:hypothetical protein